eukprot:471630-Amphidinium_carterae.1
MASRWGVMLNPWRCCCASGQKVQCLLIHCENADCIHFNCNQHMAGNYIDQRDKISIKINNKLQSNNDDSKSQCQRTTTTIVRWKNSSRQRSHQDKDTINANIIHIILINRQVKLKEGQGKTQKMHKSKLTPFLVESVPQDSVLRDVTVTQGDCPLKSALEPVMMIEVHPLRAPSARMAYSNQNALYSCAQATHTTNATGRMMSSFSNCHC